MKHLRKLILVLCCLLLSGCTSCSLNNPLIAIKNFTTTYSESVNTKEYANNLHRFKKYCTGKLAKRIAIAPSALGDSVTGSVTLLSYGATKDNEGFAIVRIDYSIGAPIIRFYKYTMTDNLISDMSYTYEYPVNAE
jgi:hypothetical protein